MKIRPAHVRDMDKCEAIYAHHVMTGFASFDENVPKRGSMAMS